MKQPVTEAVLCYSVFSIRRRQAGIKHGDRCISCVTSNATHDADVHLSFLIQCGLADRHQRSGEDTVSVFDTS
jgi:hypothetical protein